MESEPITRRKFVEQAAIAGSAALLASPLLSISAGTAEAVTVGQVIDRFVAQIKGAPYAGTVDTLKSGSRDIQVTGIVTAMFATIDVIRKAIELKANFIVAHEPTFYNHADETAWLEKSDVYQYKMNLLKEHNIAVWRNHDDIHSLTPDPVRKAVVELLGWQPYGDPAQPLYVIDANPSVHELIGHCKKQLDIQMVRYVGDLSQRGRRILLMIGAPGGRRQIEAIMNYNPDVIICGELSEWETAEYVRDAHLKGDKLSLIVIGHIASEEPGSEWMARWLRENYKGIPVTHIHSGNSLSFA